MLPTMVHPINVGVTRSTSHLKKYGNQGLDKPSSVGKMGDQLPRLQLFERVHRLIETVAFKRRDSIIHATVGKHGRDPCFFSFPSPTVHVENYG